MNLQDREQNAASRILAVAEVLLDEVPATFREVRGDPRERSVIRLETYAAFFEVLLLESIAPGLSAVLEGYSSISVLKTTSDEDLLALDGMDKQTLKALRSRLASKKKVAPEPVVEEVEEAEEPPKDLAQLVAELDDEDKKRGRK